MAPKRFLDLIWNDPHSDATGYLVIDTLIRGVAGGGCRMRPGCTFEEVARLAETMTSKFALFDVPIGGAKAGIDYDPESPDADQVLFRFFTAIAPYLRDAFVVGPGLGTSEGQILRTLNRVQIASPAFPVVHQWGLAPYAEETLRRALSLKFGGMTLNGSVTGFGVAICAQQALARRHMTVRDARIALQGFGSVGGAAAKYLAQEGAQIVAVADIEGTVARRDGMDVDLLLSARAQSGVIDRQKLPRDYVRLGPDAWYTEPSDVLIPAALADVIDFYRADQITASVVVEGAHMPLTARAEELLFKRGVTLIPDFLANSAFAYIFGALLMGNVSADADAMLSLVAGQLRERCERVLDGAERGLLPRQTAVAIAQENLARLRLQESTYA